MTAFKEYMWELLTRPFRKKDSLIVKTYTLMAGAMLDDVKACIFRLRRQWLVPTAGEKALQLLGDERGIYRYDDEPLGIFRNRVQGAYEIYAFGGTRPGMIRALEMLGYNPEIQERTKTWAHFAVMLPLELDKGFSPEEYRRLRDMVWLMKSAHTMPEYELRFTPETQKFSIIPKAKVKAEIVAKWDFWWLMWKLYRLDGTVPLDGRITLGEGWYDPVYDSTFYDGWRWVNNVMNRTRLNVHAAAGWDYWRTRALYLDGSVRLDGSSLLDGRTRIYAEGEHNFVNRAVIKQTVHAEMIFADYMKAEIN